jgi:hypothetical protein
MANQMIALGVRGPQLPDLGAAAARYGAMANTLVQQRAAERQSAQSQQAMEIARNQEGRAVEQHRVKQAKDQMEYYTVRAGQTMNRAGYEQLLGQLDRDAPEIAAQFRTNLPPEQFNRDSLLMMVGDIGDNFKARFGPLEHEVVQLKDGSYGVAQTGGAPDRPSGIFRLEEFEMVPADTGGGGGVGGPDPEQRDPAASPTGLNAAPGETPGQMMDRGIPAANIPTRSPTAPPTPALTPASAGGEMGGVQPLDMQTAPQIIQNAIQNRVIDEMHVQQLRAVFQQDPATAAQNERALAEWMRQHQIRIQPTGEAPIQPGMRSAEYRPGVDAAPQFQQVQNAPSGMTYRPTGRTATGRDPTVGQYPGSDLVPIERSARRAGAEAEASREPIGRAAVRERETTRAQGEAEASTIYERTRRERQAENDAVFVNTYASSSSTVRDGLNVINQLIGDATVVNGAVVVPRGGRPTHRGFQGLVGVGIPGLRLLPATTERDADALYTQIKGRAFLEAFETLKGGGQITEREGQAATEAITRLERNISEAEFVRAANELRDIMRRALARADRRAAALGLTPPPTAAAPATPANTGSNRPSPRATRRGTPVRGNW